MSNTVRQYGHVGSESLTRKLLRFDVIQVVETMPSRSSALFDDTDNVEPELRRSARTVRKVTSGAMVPSTLTSNAGDGTSSNRKVPQKRKTNKSDNGEDNLESSLPEDKMTRVKSTKQVKDKLSDLDFILNSPKSPLTKVNISVSINARAITISLLLKLVGSLGLGH